jgi:hypothetical protein
MILEGIEGSSVNEPVAVSRKQEQAKWLNDGDLKPARNFRILPLNIQ